MAASRERATVGGIFYSCLGIAEARVPGARTNPGTEVTGQTKESFGWSSVRIGGGELEVSDGAYADAVIHRMEASFVLCIFCFFRQPSSAQRLAVIVVVSVVSGFTPSRHFLSPSIEPFLTSSIVHAAFSWEGCWRDAAGGWTLKTSTCALPFSRRSELEVKI
jgi:hypothetical protein